MDINRLKYVLYKEIIHIKRDRISLAISFIIPIIMLIVFGYAVNLDVNNIKMAVVDQDKSTQSRELINAFKNTGYFTLTRFTDDIEEIRKLIDRGDVKAGLIIPNGYSKKILRSETAEVAFLIDGSDPTIAKTSLFVSQIVSQIKSLSIQTEIIEKKGIQITQGGIDLRYRVLYNPEMRSTNFNIPGLIGLILQNITIILTAFSLVREKERGTIELLIVTPIKPAELIIGKLIPYIIIAFTDVIMVLIVGTFWFKVPINGSVILLLFLSLIFLFGALGVGMLISTVAKNQLQAMQMAFVYILPSFILSGFVFPRESMPLILQILGYFIPLTYFLKILRSIILKGVGLDILLIDTLLLLAFSIFILIVSILKFRKTLE